MSNLILLIMAFVAGAVIGVLTTVCIVIRIFTKEAKEIDDHFKV